MERFANSTGRRTTEMKAITQTFNKNVRGWGGSTKSKLAASAASNTQKSKTLRNSIKNRFRTTNEQIYNIGFSFPLQGIWVHYGVGKGYKRENGTVVRYAKSQTDKPRRPRDWFNSVVKNQLPELEQTVTEMFDGAVLNATNIYIKDGVTDK